MTTHTPIHAPFVEGHGPLTLRIDLGACRVRIQPGAEEAWLEGSYTDPTEDLPVRFVVEGGTVRLTQERRFAGAVGLVKGAPTCELQLGTGRPYRLVIDTGASELEADLGGLPLTSLEVRSGAGKVTLEVSQPNPGEAEDVVLRVGAGSLETDRLGNLNGSSLRVDGGAANVELDLTGELRRRLDVRVSAGMSGVTLTVPADRPGRVDVDTTLGGTDVGDGFVTHDGAYHTTVDGDPQLTVRASIAVGGIKLRTR